MILFGRELEPGQFTCERDGARAVYSVEPVEGGVRVSGTISGNPGRLECISFVHSGKVLVNNWQSWGPMEWSIGGARFEGIDTVMREYSRTIFTPVPDILERRAVSDYFIMTADIFIGFLSSRIAHPYFLVTEKEISVCLEYFGKTLDGPVQLEPFVVLAAGNGCLERYGLLLAEENRPEISPWNPVGWCSWYQYFTRVRWSDIQKNLSLAAGRYPYEVFQIDDGYEADIGDWLDRGRSWPPLDEMAAEIATHGFQAGIWTAPFSASQTSRLFREHPEWMVQEGGNPKPCYRGWGKTIYALDTSSREVIEWLHGLFRSIRDAGYSYFKIDFLFAAAMPGDRQAPVTPIEAYRMGLGAIREAVGNDFILGCGAPLLPSIGFLDGMRVGEDTAPFWKPELSGVQGANAYRALRNPLMRQFMHRKIWLNDPDCLLLRNSDLELTENERRLYALVCGLLDSMIIQSDDLALVDAGGEQLLHECLRLRGGTATVANPAGDDFFVVSSSGGPAGNVRLGANLGESDRTFEGISIPRRSVVRLTDHSTNP